MSGSWLCLSVSRLLTPYLIGQHRYISSSNSRQAVVRNQKDKASWRESATVDKGRPTLTTSHI